MIESFKHKGLRNLFEQDDARKVKADQVDRLRLILSTLDQASGVQDMNQPTFRLHSLKGNRKGVGAVTVRANWRVTFRFEGATPTTWIWKITIRGDDAMPMKNPVHPGALARANLDELNLSVAEAAKTMKITRQQLHNVMQGRSAVTPEMALRFEKAFGGSADMWLRMQAAYDLARARKNQRKMKYPAPCRASFALSAARLFPLGAGTLNTRLAL
jgi:addiction module HigA family antidote